jgi:hypothetical protein
MTQKKYLIFILLGTFIVIVSIVSAMNGGDFDVFLHAAEKLENGQNIYTPPFIRDLQYFYSPLFALLLIPFCKYYFVSELVWLLFSFFLLYRIWNLCKAYFDVKMLTNKQYKIWVFLIAVLSFQFIKYNISLVQVTIFLLWASLESLNMFDQKKAIAGALILALAINMKLLPLTLIPYLLYRRYFKETIFVVLFSVLLLYLPVLFLGFEHNNFLLSEWWHVINPSNKEHMFEENNGTNGLVALIPVYLTDTVGELPINRNFINLSPQTVGIIINVTRLLFIAFILVVLRSMPFRKEVDKQQKFWEFSYLLLVTPLIFPHQQKYALLFALPMVMYITYYIVAKWEMIKGSAFYKSWLIVFIVAMLFYSPLYGSDIMGRYLFTLSQHFRVLSFSTILLIPISFVFNHRNFQRG